MAKSRRRSETAAVEAEAPATQPESSQPEADTATNGHAARVAARAYELYLARGGAHGNDWDDWLTAERELAGTRAETEER